VKRTRGMGVIQMTAEIPSDSVNALQMTPSFVPTVEKAGFILLAPVVVVVLHADLSREDECPSRSRVS